MFKEYPDDIRLNDSTEFTMTIEGDFSKLFEVLGIEIPKKEDSLEALKNACEVVELNNKCFTSPNDVCFTKSCKECEYYQDAEVVYKAVNQLLDHAKKSLNVGEEDAGNRYIRNVTGGVELYDDANNFVGYVHGFRGVKSEADIRSIVQNSWGLLTLNPFTLEKIVEDHGYIADMHFIVEMYKDYSDIQLPKDWQLIKRVAKEDSK